MIKFLSISDEGRVLLGLIIVEGNIKFLKEDKPIHINAEEMGLPNFNVNDIIIAYYSTETEAIKALTEAGLFTNETKVTKVERMKH